MRSAISPDSPALPFSNADGEGRVRQAVLLRRWFFAPNYHFSGISVTLKLQSERARDEQRRE
jgi:hypothetical protein